jgi:hypothetical protein
MYQDLIVMSLITLLTGSSAIVILRTLWKTKRHRRDLPGFSSRERRALSR